MNNNEIFQLHYKFDKKEYSRKVDLNESVMFFNNLIWMNSEDAAFYLMVLR